MGPVRTRSAGTRSMLVAAAVALLAATAMPAAAAAGPADAVTLTGTLRSVVADDFVRGRSQVRHLLQTATGRVPLVAAGAMAGALAGDDVTVRGQRLADGRVRVSGIVPSRGPNAVPAQDQDAARPDGSRSTPAAAEAPVAGASVAEAPYGWAGPERRRVAFVIATYTDLPQPNGTPAEVQAALTGPGASVRTFFETASRGRVSIDATVLGPWALPIDSCPAPTSFTDTADAVEARAAADGIDFAGFDHVVMWTPAPCASGWTALGEAPGQFIQLSAAYPDSGSRTDELANVLAHELGHNLGLLHANGLACRTGVGEPGALTGACTAIEYGDPFSTMGGDQGFDVDPTPVLRLRFLSPLFGAAELAHLGWLDPAEEEVATAAGTYRLVGTYSTQPGVRLLRVRRTPGPVATDPSNGDPLRSGWLTLELRTGSPAGPFDAWLAGSPVTTGLVVRYAEDPFDWSGGGFLPALGTTYLVDTVPATVGADMADSELHDAPLAVGATVVDEVHGTRITLDALDPGGATVTIAFPSGPPPAAPVIEAPAVTGVTPASGSATVTWSAPATHGAFPVLGYAVRSHPGGRVCGSSPEWGLGCTVTGLANGTAYRFTVTATTAGGHWRMSLPSGAVTPSEPPVATLAPLSSWRTTQAVPLAWAGSDDGGPVDTFDVRVRSAPWNGGFGSWATWLPATTGVRATFTGLPGRTYCFAVRAANDGVTGPWSAQACTAVPLDDRSLVASPAWTRITGSPFYRGTATRTTRQGATLTRTRVQARRVALVASTCPTCGSIRVYWNGAYRRTLSLRSSTTRHRVLLAALSFSTVRTGTLRLVVASSARRVTVDGIVAARR